MTISYELVFSGQKRRYGDSYRIYNIKTDIVDKAAILKYCQENIAVYPEKDEFFDRFYSGDKKYDYDYYFGGYCELIKTGDGWQYTICHPYAD